MNKKDLRVVKTQNILYRTLLDLMKEKTFEEIKVSDICNQALINRSTFYAHYNDKYELLAEFIQELKNSLTGELKKNKNISNTKEYYLEMIKLFLDHIEEKRESYLAIMIHNRNSITMDIIYDVLDHDITSHLQQVDSIDENQIPRSIIAKFYIGAVVNVGIEWLKNGKQYTKENMIEYFKVLIPDELNHKV
ncbi:MAG: TetR/AcrR family transcriptional regulator [Bacilli bacterium]|nr:TetR/AcrR family transcriptional regulator [Bacilli bacterium]